MIYDEGFVGLGVELSIHYFGIDDDDVEDYIFDLVEQLQHNDERFDFGYDYDYAYIGIPFSEMLYTETLEDLHTIVTKAFQEHGQYIVENLKKDNKKLDIKKIIEG